MAMIPANCPTHGTVQVPYIFAGAANVEIFGGAAACPICGKTAVIADGGYSFDDANVPGVTLFRPITPAQARKVKTAVEWGRKELDAGAESVAVKEKIDAVLEQHAPGWKRALDVLLSDRAGNVYQLLGFILTLLMFFGLDGASQGAEAPPVPGVTEEQIREMFEEYLDQHDMERETPTTPSPTPRPEPTHDV